MNTWIAGKYLMENHYLIKKLFIVNYIYKILVMKNISMLKKYLKNLNQKNLVEHHDLYLKSDVLLLA